MKTILIILTIITFILPSCKSSIRKWSPLVVESVETNECSIKGQLEIYSIYRTNNPYGIFVLDIYDVPNKWIIGDTIKLTK